MKLELPLHSFKAKSVRQNAQDLLNMYAVLDETSSKSQYVLYPRSGLTLFTTLDADATAVLGATYAKGLAYFVYHNRVTNTTKLASVDSSGTVTVRGTLSAMSDTSRPSIAVNFDQILIATGVNSFVYDIPTTTLTQITDVDYPANVEIVGSMQEYFFAFKPDSDIFYLSNLQDGTTWQALNFAAAETCPDDLVGFGTLHTYVWLFGERKTEIWANTSPETDGVPFQPQPSVYVDFGCVAPHSIANAGTSLYWLSRTSNGQGLVLRASSPTDMSVVSTDSQHEAFTGYTLETAFAYTRQERGQEFYVITFPDDDITLSLNTRTGKWNEEKCKDPSALIPPVFTRSRANCYAFLNGLHLVGDYQSGKIFKFNPDDYYDDVDNEIIKQIVTPSYNVGGRRKTIYSLELFTEPGIGTIDGQGENPLIGLEVSRDGGFTYGTQRLIDFGTLGDYKRRIRWNRLGSARDWVFRFTVTDPVKTIFLGLEAEVSDEKEYPSQMQSKEAE